MKIEKIYQVVESDYEDHKVHRTFADKADAEEFAATYAWAIGDYVDIEEHVVSQFAPDASVWWEINGFRHDTPRIGAPYKRVYWSDEATTEPEGDPAVEYGISAQGSEMITVLSRTQEGARYGLNQAMLTRWNYNPIAERNDANEKYKKAMLSLLQGFEMLGGGGSFGGGGV